MTQSAADILKAALGHMEDRAATYDKPEGERSMPATVAAFNALTGHALTAEQGWLFMAVLKLCRTQQGGFRADNYEDGSAYFALMGEQASGDRKEPSGGIKPDMAAPVCLSAEPVDPNRSKGYGPCDEEGWRNWNGKLAIPYGDVEVRNRAGQILSGRGQSFDWSLSDEVASQYDIVEWRWASKPADLPGQWIEHDGTGCPTSGRVEVQYVNGQTSRCEARHAAWGAVKKYRPL